MNTNEYRRNSGSCDIVYSRELDEGLAEAELSSYPERREHCEKASLHSKVGRGLLTSPLPLLRVQQ